MAKPKKTPPAQPTHPLLLALNARRAGSDRTDENARAWPWWAPLVIAVMAKGGMTLTKAAQTVGVARSTAYALRAKDAAFAEALDEARESCLDLMESKLVEAATKGIPNRTTTTRTYPDGTREVTVKEGADFHPTAAFFMLKRYRPEFRDSFKAEITGADGGPVQIESIDRIDRQIAALNEELARRGAGMTPRDLVDPDLVPAGADDDGDG